MAENTVFYLSNDPDNEISLPIEGTLTSDSYENKQGITINNLVKVEIGTKVKSIGNNAFQNCKKLQSVTFNETSKVETIGDYAFGYCRALQYVTIGNSVKTIGNYAFRSCIALQSVTFNETSKVETIGDYAFGACGALQSVTIGNSVKTIGDYAFQNCKKLQSVTFNETSKVETIGDYAFGSCRVLQTLTIPDSVTSIGDSAFEYTGISNVKMPVKLALFLNITANVKNDFFGQQNVFVKCSTTFIQPGIISGETKFDNWSSTDVKIALRYYKPTLRTYEQPRDGFFIADLTKIAAIENASISKIEWLKKNRDDDNYIVQERATNFERTFPYNGDIVKVKCTYSVNGNETTIESNPTLITKNAISDNYFEFETLDNLSDNFTNTEFRKTLTMVFFSIESITTISNAGLFENESFLYENMQEVEVPRTVTSITGTPFPASTRYYIRSIKKYLNPNTFPWVNDPNKQFFFYLNENSNQLAKTKENDGVKISIITRPFKNSDPSKPFMDSIVYLYEIGKPINSENISIDLGPTNTYSNNSYYITDIDMTSHQINYHLYSSDYQEWLYETIGGDILSLNRGEYSQNRIILHFPNGVAMDSPEDNKIYFVSILTDIVLKYKNESNSLDAIGIIDYIENSNKDIDELVRLSEEAAAVQEAAAEEEAAEEGPEEGPAQCECCTIA